MSEQDLYHHWLGITPQEQPPSLYRLLGVGDFEQDMEVIRNAAERQAFHVRRLARGEFTEIGQQLLNEIAAAKLTLMSPEKREAYDRSLSERIEVKTSQASDRDADKTMSQVASEDDLGLEISPVQATRIDIETCSTKNRWILGYHPDCDFHVEGDHISGVHCQIKQTGSGVFIADLNSTNGTYVNQQRIRESTRIGRLDLLTLGRDHRIVLPDYLMARDDQQDANALFVGRGKGNEIQLESPRVSYYHARLIIHGRSVVVEDLKSKHGTFVAHGDGAPAGIDRLRLTKNDVVRFADVEITASRLMELGRIC